MGRLKKITKKQASAFSSVIKAIERAQKTGIVFFGKQWDLVAYTQESADYESEHDLLVNRNTTGKNDVEYLSASVLYDSGADDYSHYLTDEDDPYNGEYQETPSTYFYNKNRL